MKTTPNMSMPSHSQQAMRRHRLGVGAPARVVPKEAGAAVCVRGGSGHSQVRPVGPGASCKPTEDTGRRCQGSPGEALAGGAFRAAATQWGGAAGTALGIATGAVSTPAVEAAGAGDAGPAVVAGAGTGTATRGEWSTTGGILGAFGRSGLACVAAGTCTSFLGDTGLRAGAAPCGVGGCFGSQGLALFVRQCLIGLPLGALVIIRPGVW